MAEAVQAFVLLCGSAALLLAAATLAPSIRTASHLSA
jgi:hypothetical protein